MIRDTQERPVPPVLLLAWRRPDTTAEVLAALRQVRPPCLFIACDGPRPGVIGDSGEPFDFRG